MKKKWIIGVCVLAGAFVGLVGFGVFWLDFSDSFGVHKKQMIEYYSNDDNYYKAQGTIDEALSIDDGGCILRLSGILYEREVYGWDPCSYAVRYEGAQKIWETWTPKKGMKIDFVSADRIFYDGYTWPIVSISYLGQSILDFEAGKAKLIGWVQSN